MESLSQGTQLYCVFCIEKKKKKKQIRIIKLVLQYARAYNHEFHFFILPSFGYSVVQIMEKYESIKEAK